MAGHATSHRSCSPQSTGRIPAAVHLACRVSRSTAGTAGRTTIVFEPWSILWPAS